MEELNKLQLKKVKMKVPLIKEFIRIVRNSVDFGMDR